MFVWPHSRPCWVANIFTLDISHWHKLFNQLLSCLQACRYHPQRFYTTFSGLDLGWGHKVCRNQNLLGSFSCSLLNWSGWHDLLQPQFDLFLWGGKGEESTVCFAGIYLGAPVQCPLADTTGGFLDPVGCSGGVLRCIPDCQVVCI